MKNNLYNVTALSKALALISFIAFIASAFYLGRFSSVNYQASVNQQTVENKEVLVPANQQIIEIEVPKGLIPDGEHLTKPIEDVIVSPIPPFSLETANIKGGVLDFTYQDKTFLEALPEFEVRLETVKKAEEDGNYYYQQYVFYKDNIKELILSPYQDTVQVKDDGSFYVHSEVAKERLYDIRSKVILSSSFKTKEGVSVGMTIEDFIKIHENYSIRYSWISHLYYIKDGNKNGVHYVLSPEDLLKETPLPEGEEVDLDSSYFSPTSEIKEINIYLDL